jgi:RNA-dependent RNA polymerase
VGIADVHQYLRPGEVFVCVNNFDGHRPKFLEGDVVVSRSPVIHPGDVQIARAIGAPPPGSCFSVEPLTNAIVFNTTGEHLSICEFQHELNYHEITDNRPMPSCLGGGDLDGDEYNVIPLAELPEFRPASCQSASQYTPAPRRELSRPCTQDDVADFIVEYITSDVRLYDHFSEFYRTHALAGTGIRVYQLAYNRRPKHYIPS